jgi:hypothetical protein
MMPADDRKTSQIVQPLLIATAILLGVASGMVGIVREAAEFGPRVGDLVSFDPIRRVAFESSARLTAGRPGSGECMLDIATIQRSGGSLVVERRGASPDRLYQAHWSGLRTSRDTDDCGRDADLMLSSVDLDTLATAAGGFGVDHTSVWRLQ